MSVLVRKYYTQWGMEKGAWKTGVFSAKFYNLLGMEEHTFLGFQEGFVSSPDSYEGGDFDNWEPEKEEDYMC